MLSSSPAPDRGSSPPCPASARRDTVAHVNPGDARAFFNQYGPMVHRRALSILGNDADAQEATQEVFIRALSGLESFDPRASLSTKPRRRAAFCEPA